MDKMLACWQSIVKSIRARKSTPGVLIAVFALAASGGVAAERQALRN
jgi:hypothetical protein